MARIIRGPNHPKEPQPFSMRQPTPPQCKECGYFGGHWTGCPKDDPTPEGPKEKPELAPPICSFAGCGEVAHLNQQGMPSNPDWGFEPGLGWFCPDHNVDDPDEDDDDPMVLEGLRESQLDEAMELGRELGQLRAKVAEAKVAAEKLKEKLHQVEECAMALRVVTEHYPNWAGVGFREGRLAEAIEQAKAAGKVLCLGLGVPHE